MVNHLNLIIRIKINMSIQINIDLDYEKIIDVFNSLDKIGILIDFDENELFTNLIDEKMIDEISFFIDRGTDVKRFLNLCTVDDKEVITFLIESDADASENPGEFLCDLINTENFHGAELMIETYKAPILELINYSNGKPLRTAVRKGNTEMISYLFLCGAKVKECDIDPITDALVFNKYELVPLLLNHGSDITSILPEHLEICLKKKYKLSVNYIYSKLLLNQLPHFKNVDLTNCFIAACNYGNYDILKYFIDNGIVNLDDNTYFQLKRNIKNNWVFHYLVLAKKTSSEPKIGNKKKSPKSKKYDSDENFSDNESQSDDDEKYVPIRKSKSGVRFKN
ncbi:ankyrin repeat domain-containing protein 1-like [Tupanvirus soda lake]|uniref:Ankyrin repeat domain-containing protein 1-like n=2 Tax=Tupanvirus TaxID=2094720 RepID=A0A6N1NKF6_9VIRU|nr:ankyrin repeat domain-containing protein 1-like [Tupanvirus soda lake]QKU34800.1 ankyrin repeat domain-containing protein 1-like [Tupanvirus soda lake]